jgi:tetratricopeptide (TPR) repeat protein
MTELLSKEIKLNPKEAVAILRNKDGLNDTSIGYGNEKAINQLLAHHGIVFQPEELKVWVSSHPYQLGEFVAYDLIKVFANRKNNPSETTISETELNIAEDPFVDTVSYQNYEAYRVLEHKVEHAIDSKIQVSDEDLQHLTLYNPDYWKSHYLLGRYYYEQKKYSSALTLFKIAAKQEITTKEDEKLIAKYIKKCMQKVAQ